MDASVEAYKKRTMPRSSLRSGLRNVPGSNSATRKWRWNSRRGNPAVTGVLIRCAFPQTRLKLRAPASRWLRQRLGGVDEDDVCCGSVKTEEW